MLRRILIPLWLAALVVAGCGGNKPTPTTAPVIVVTATAESNSTSLPAATPTDESAAGTPASSSAQSTKVQSITAKAAVNVRRQPSLDGEVLGQIYPGETAKVTGASADGNWWQIECPAGLSGDCWVSADPQLTESATP